MKELNEMNTVDLVLKNCKIVTSRGVQEAGLAINDGRIVAISKSFLLPKADTTIDSEGKFVIPGGIDAHVHFMDPGYTYRENWETGSKSAAAGGVTFVIDHGLTNPPSTTVGNLNKIISEAEKKSVIDFGINGSVTPHNLTELPKLAEAGITAFGEVYMAESVKGSETIDDGTLFEAFQVIGKCGGIVGVHAENGEVVSYLTRKLREEGRKDPLAHSEARPNLAEAEAISRALMFARYANVRLHIFHMTTREGIKLVADAKRAGQSVSAETCPHYLLFTKEDMVKYGPYIKCNPPIRSKEDSHALWKALRQEDIDMVSTDHWPSLKSEKETGWESIWEADSGMPGVETRIPLLLTFGVQQGLISMQTFVKITSENPARVFGAYPRKGAIMVGSDADLVIIDMKKKITIKAENLHTKAEFTSYEGWKVQGIPLTTLVRGQVVMQEEEIIAKPGYGSFIKRQQT